MKESDNNSCSKREERKELYQTAQMNKMSDLMDRVINELDGLEEPDEFGVCKMSYQRLRKICKQRADYSYGSGFFFGISVATYRGWEQKEKQKLKDQIAALIKAYDSMFHLCPEANKAILNKVIKDNQIKTRRSVTAL